MAYDPRRALELLRLGSNLPTATFREGQEEAIRHVVEGRGRLLVVQKTGWGKSFVYFIATKLLRESGGGPALLISPLLALMRNQIAAATRMGVQAVTINSDNLDDWNQVEEQILRNAVDLLLISPERLANDRFRNNVLARIAGRVSLLVIDEAHCISDWGHDFRPHYRLLERVARTLPPNMRLLATTATANNRVMDDLRQVLGPQLEVMRGNLGRPSLTLQTIRMGTQAERLAWLAEQLPKLAGNGVIYTLTVRDANQVSEWLQSRGLNVEAYTGDTGDRREELEHALLENHVKALVATTALGMGFDKPDLAFVIHYQTPGSVVAYYQQVGRAGRAIPLAYGVLLSGDEDQEITDFFIESAFPTKAEVDQVIHALEAAPDGLSVPELMTQVNLTKGRIEKTIQMLALESPSPIAKQGTKWQLTAARLSDNFWQRAERLTKLRRDEQLKMQEYIALQSGHMQFLVRELDGEPDENTPPGLVLLPTAPIAPLVQEAVTFLKRTSLPIEPRLRWPAGGMPRYGITGVIPAPERVEPGKALSVWGDAGWGTEVKNGKYRDGRFSDALVRAGAEMVRAWHPKPASAWVTCIPSLRHPILVRDFAERLANALGLRFEIVLQKTDNRPEQKSMANSTQQARNLDGALNIAVKHLPPGDVLLVDDLIDSRWTITVAGWLLRSHGSGRVFPVALSYAGRGQ
ncbi:MAG TPA: RecQ family ATP-dependent DNA helicase [Candidatus Saccharimonadales bacterium]|jgi:ATP-dependent DNA helicase RecQ|nr:RecQ family ATP-dependent DNA helicase [Candidatus Saccharimonadales bacterium]